MIHRWEEGIKLAKIKTVYVCSDCGSETPNWAGKCPYCGAWNTLKELRLESGKTKASAVHQVDDAPQPKRITELDTEKEIRVSTGISELDRVLGGGAVVGSLNLVGGAPGIGKSTLLLQMCGKLHSDSVILYITGEESERQIRLRADRLQVHNENLYVFAETDMDRIAKAIEKLMPDVVILDSVQTVSDSSVQSTPGSVSQIRECTMRILRITKEKSLTVFLIGHVTKDGTLAGPKILEHMVDCVLYFEGERENSFRILRAVKNRFGSTNEIGVFEMESVGLVCVENPSEVMLSGRPENASGTCVTCALEGTRPILAEIQALVTENPRNNASRRSNGIDYNRAAMLLAVLEKRGGLPMGGSDTYINVVGGLTLEEPAADLATVLSLASSYLDRPIGAEVAAIGEVGLSGELRQVSALNQRLSEIARLGFRRCVIPSGGKEKAAEIEGLEVIKVKNISQAIAAVLGKQKGRG
ncbi:MAG: DNA repair protein RadA [Oscillospiraceae bacterium]|nr:DNA repair protein RadA [Oscillospiraceae bacterium]